jgi:hypothetical protein
MRRVLLAPLVAPLAVLLPLLSIAGCEGGGPPPPGPLGPTEGLHAGFPKGGLADMIRIDAIERLPLRAAVLVAPDGTTLAAGNIDVTDSPSFATGQWAAGDPWRNALLGDGSAAALAMQHADVGAALQGRQQLLATVSTAEIVLPDPVSYRRQWGKYRIRLSFGTPPGDTETREIAAPEPPPAGS